MNSAAGGQLHGDFGESFLIQAELGKGLRIKFRRCPVI